MVDTAEPRTIPVSEEITSITLPERSQLIDITQGTLGFHYTVDRALPGSFQHGVLSRNEERKRGLSIRTGASRSQPDRVYFTTRYNNLYMHDDFDKTLEENLRDVVGLVFERPASAQRFLNANGHGHYLEENFVEPERIHGLIFIDRVADYKHQSVQKDLYDAYTFHESLPAEQIEARVAKLRKLCEESGMDLPIYGVSGDMYWPQHMKRSDVIKALRTIRTSI